MRSACQWVPLRLDIRNKVAQRIEGSLLVYQSLGAFRLGILSQLKALRLFSCLQYGWMTSGHERTAALGGGLHPRLEYLTFLMIGLKNVCCYQWLEVDHKVQCFHISEECFSFSIYNTSPFSLASSVKLYFRSTESPIFLYGFSYTGLRHMSFSSAVCKLTPFCLEHLLFTTLPGAFL
ncbi:hypothetical protein Tco_0468395 [Tanacetum coccineum]